MQRTFRAIVAILLVIATPFVCAGAMLGAYLFLPLPAELPSGEVPTTSQVTRVLDAQGNEIGIFRTFETSIPVEPEDVPEKLKQAVVAAEDRNFYEHGGVDVEGTLRALWADIRSQEIVQGGSTITQQLVKNTITGGDVTVRRKVEEAIRAAQMERQLDKDEILFRYLSVIYLGEGAYGVGAASETYFRKPVSQLTLSEAALLAGLIPAPSRYSPRVNPELAEQKRLSVLDAMLEEGMIDQADHDAAASHPVWLAAQGDAPGVVTTVYPPDTQNSVHPYFVDYVRQFLAQHPDVGEQRLRTGGLTVYTTLQPEAQFIAQARVNEQLAGTEPFVDAQGVEHTLQMALVSVDPPTGFVRSMIGGRDYNAQQVNLALGKDGGGSGRQPGSSFKPVVAAEAFEQGLTPDRVYSGGVHTVGDTTIENYGGSVYGNLTLRQALQKSVNTVFTRLVLDVGVEDTMELARRLGLDVPDFDPAVHGASVALGALEVSPLDMASAFGTFAFRGRRWEPTPVLQVADADGNIIVDYTDRQDEPERAERVLKEEVADNVTNILEGVLISGTAAGKGIGRPAAGKTGTAQENRDAWFVGYTPDVSTAVWMGYDPPAPLRGINGVSAVTGGSLPASTWNAYMEDLLRDEPVSQFSDPAPIRQIADEVQREARGGIDPGTRMYPDGGAAGGPYVFEPEGPAAPAPTTTTTTSTTTTTVPEEDDDLFGGGGGGGGGGDPPDED